MKIYYGLSTLFLFAVAESANVLFINHRTGKSHHISFVPLVEAAAERKHNATFISYFPHKHPQVKTFILQQSVSGPGNPEVMKKFALNAYEEGIIAQLGKSASFAKSDCESLLSDEFIKRLLTTGKQYDIAVVDALFGECAVVVASFLAQHIVYYYTGGWCLPWMNHAVPTPYSHVPFGIERLTSKMNLWQRFNNMRSHLIAEYIQEYHLRAVQQDVLNKNLIYSPTIDDVMKLVDFSLINGDPVTTSPRPSMPNIGYIAGPHCRPARPLLKELNDIVEDSGDDGFVLFSLGSNVGSEMMPVQFLETAISAFSHLKQKVIWKYKGQLDNLPNNVKLVDWIPQQDLLGNPKARLFITHGGLLSLQEAIYHGVPVIGIPFFGDQQGNVARVKELGIAEIADFSNITNDNLYLMIKKILNDKSYYDNMKKYSAIFKAQPQKPADSAVYWLEYVIRHNGAQHLRSAGEELGTIQYFLLDVLCVLAILTVAVLSCLTYFIKLSVRNILKRKQSGKEFKEKMK